MSLVAWLPLLYGDLNDKCGRKVDTTFGASAPSSASAGKIGKGYLFSSHGVRIKNIPVTKTMSFALWIKLTSNSACHILDLRGHDDGTETGYQPIYYDGSGIQIYSSAGANSAYNSCYLGTNWHHLVVTIEDGHGRLYLDGVYQNENTSLVGCVDTCHLTLGCRCNGNNKMPGIIQDVRIYNHVLTIKEIQELNKALVLHYTFDNSSFEDTTNYVLYPTPSSAVGAVGWDTARHPNAIYVGGWGCGYNGGVGSPTVGYHAMWNIIDEIPTIVFQNKNSEIGFSGRWMGVSGGISNDVNSALPGRTVTISFEAKGSTSGMQIATGLYYTIGTNTNFHGGCPAHNITTDWKRYSHTFPVSTSKTGGSSIYIYGHYGGEGISYVRNIQLEYKDHATEYTPTSRAPSIVDSSGLGNDGLLINPSYYRFIQDSACGSGSLHSAGAPGAYIKTALVPDFIQGTGTICFWYKKDANAFNYNNGDFLVATQHSSGYYFGATDSTNVWHNGASHSQFYIDCIGRGSGGVVDTNWHFYVFTGVNLSSWNTFALHCHGDTHWLYRGQIGDFRIYNTNLTEDDIKELYHTSWQSNQAGASFVRSVSEGSSTVKMPKNGDINCKALYETGILPVEYEALSGLYFDRGPCINTGVTINDATKPIKVAVDITAKHVTVNSCVLGCGNSLWRGPVMLNCCRYYLEAGVDGYGSNTTVPEGVYEDGERFVYHANIQPTHQTFYKNGTPIQSIPSRTLITSTYPIYIGGFNSPGGLTASDNFLGWVHYVEIEYGTIRRQMVPCRRRKDDVLGMYDMVGGQFYTAATTGSWTTRSSTISQSRTGCLCVGEIHEC